MRGCRRSSSEQKGFSWGTPVMSSRPLRPDTRETNRQAGLAFAVDGSNCVPGCAPIYHPIRWQQDGAMADNVYEFRPKAGDTEKITINLGYVDLGHIDLLVQEGF